MKTVIIVPKDKHPLELLAELGNRTRYAWIFLHKNVIAKLNESCTNKKQTRGFSTTLYSWNKTEKIPDTFVSVDYFTNSWSAVICIRSSAISFCSRSEEPTEMIFIKMDE